MDEKDKEKEDGAGHADSIAVIFKNGNESEQETITKFQNNTPFKIDWHPTDAQSGYYEVVESKGWANVYGESVSNLLKGGVDPQEIDRKVKEFMKGNGIIFYIVICRSSNDSRSGYNLFVKEQDIEKIRVFIKTKVEENEPELGAKCPKCNQGDVLLIVYGNPTKIAAEAAKKGEILLGGQPTPDNDPAFGCKQCGAKFGGKKELKQYRKFKQLFGFEG